MSKPPEMHPDSHATDATRTSASYDMSFFVGGRYVEKDDGLQMTDQLYVQRRTPTRTGRRPLLPIVMIHGGGQTAMNFETTPDGRPGWATFFAERGHAVYLVDQPSRGRSAHHRDMHDVPQVRDSASRIEDLFTAPAAAGHWRQASLHTQWPGGGRAGDPVFDQFFASQVPWIQDQAHTERLMREAGSQLLDRIGPAILLTHSQSGPFGWHLADARPGLVRAILAIEPNGPPFAFVQRVGPPRYLEDGDFRWPYGITATAVAYDPPVTDPAIDLPFVRDTPGDPTLVARCYLQAEPPRRLVNVSRCPVLLVTGEASYHAAFDHCTVAYLRQSGVDVTHLELAEIGIGGNGHMMMLERNSDTIAAALQRWLRGRDLDVAE